MNQTHIEQAPFYVRIPAKILSYIFHPLFIPTYVFVWLMYRFPYEFAGIDARTLKFRLFSVFWMTAFFPAFAVFLMWRLKLVKNIFLKTQQERIAPYIISMIFYWWMWFLSRTFTDQPLSLRFFYLGIFFATILALILNNFLKISMHAMGVAGALSCVLLSCFLFRSYQGADLIFATLLTGLVATSRLLLNNHTTGEIYTGFFVGIICQLVAFWIVI